LWLGEESHTVTLAFQRRCLLQRSIAGYRWSHSNDPWEHSHETRVPFLLRVTRWKDCAMSQKDRSADPTPPKLDRDGFSEFAYDLGVELTNSDDRLRRDELRGAIAAVRGGRELDPGLAPAKRELLARLLQLTEDQLQNIEFLFLDEPDDWVRAEPMADLNDKKGGA